jgi:hypothetical protein
VGAFVTEVGAYVLQQMLNIVPPWVPYPTFVILLGIWMAIYLFYLKPRDDRSRHPSEELERSIFRNQVTEEIRSILDQISGRIEVPSRISYQVWRSKSDAEKIELLGDDDYRSVNALYNSVDRSNQITERGDRDSIENAMKKTAFLAIHKEAERVFNEVKWLNLQKSGTRQLHDATK